MKFKWEDLPDNRLKSASQRVKVIGGWLVHSIVGVKDNGMSTCMAFVPDEKHEWNVKDE